MRNTQGGPGKECGGLTFTHSPLPLRTRTGSTRFPGAMPLPPPHLMLPGVAAPPVSKPGGDERLRRSSVWARMEDRGWRRHVNTERVTLCAEGHFLFGVRVCALEFWCGPIHAHGNHSAESWLQAPMRATLVPGMEPAQELPGGPEYQPKSPFCFPNGFYPKFWEANLSNIKWETLMRSIGTPHLDSKPGLQDWHPKPRVKARWLFRNEAPELSSLHRDCAKLGFLAGWLLRTSVLTFLCLSLPLDASSSHW